MSGMETVFWNVVLLVLATSFALALVRLPLSKIESLRLHVGKR